MYNNSCLGERLSFYQLIAEKKYKIKIPIIQRDYAQGRSSTKEIRTTFLKALKGYLEEDIPFRDLDFVYGSILSDGECNNFIPLDGQQRLTTLFLLHWYFYQQSTDEIKKNDFYNAIFQNNESMFTYETRVSSSDFCNALVSNIVEITSTKSLSATIMNYSWFYLSWKYDPTVQSMLRMLDEIQIIFTDCKKYFEKLLDTKKPIITFLFLNLEDFKLTDELYIKMNSRGKPLTDFENFKAKFEQYLEGISTSREFTLNCDERIKQVSLNEYFSYNIDTKWSYLFWNYRDENSQTFDNELMNFIRVIFTYQYALDSDIKEEENYLDQLLGSRVQESYSANFTYHTFEDCNALSEEGVLFLIDCLDILSNEYEEIKVYLKNEYFYNEKSAFNNAIHHSFESYHKRIMFYAYLAFLIYHKGEIIGLEDWMRVIHNLTHPENTIIDASNEFSLALKEVTKLLSQSNNILEYLKTDPKIQRFLPVQVLEEKIKSHLITKGNHWKQSIENLEQHSYFNGQIGFILYFSGIITYYQENTNNCNWSNNEDNEYYAKFLDYAEKASFVFAGTHEKRQNNEDYIFERAVLTKGEYFAKHSDGIRQNTLTSSKGGNTKRDYSWKRHLRISENSSSQEPCIALVQQVFDDKRCNKTLMRESLELICKDRTETWRDIFIVEPKIFNYCTQGFIRYENTNSILVYGQSQSNHYHAELYTYYLWKHSIEPQTSLNEQSVYSIFENVEYYQSKSIDDSPAVSLEGFVYDNETYDIYIYHYFCYESSRAIYEITFNQRDEETVIVDNIPQNLLKILIDLNFYYKEEQNESGQENNLWTIQLSNNEFSGIFNLLLSRLNELITD